jgi:hypothetical protein
LGALPPIFVPRPSVLFAVASTLFFSLLFLSPSHIDWVSLFDITPQNFLAEVFF